MVVTEEDVRKALEDLVHANIVEIFNAKYGEQSCLAGEDTPVAFTAPVYDSETDYAVEIIQAVDSNGIDLRHAIEIKTLTANGFVLNSPRNTTAKWTSIRRTPKITFHTA